MLNAMLVLSKKLKIFDKVKYIIWLNYRFYLPTLKIIDKIIKEEHL